MKHQIQLHIWFDWWRLFIHKLCKNLKKVLKCVYLLIGLKLKYCDYFDKYWFVLYFSPKFETDPKRMGINDIVKLWGWTISFIEMIKCSTYTFAQFTQRQAKSILNICSSSVSQFHSPRKFILSTKEKQNHEMYPFPLHCVRKCTD